MKYTREQIEHYIGSVEVLAKVCTEITVDTSGIRMLRQLLAENDALRAANNEWEEKTRWVCGAGAKPKELGMHRADVLKQRIDALREDAERNKVDAACFRWWVHEAAANPSLVAKAICHCITEDEYRAVICGAMNAKDAVIDAARRKY